MKYVAKEDVIKGLVDINKPLTEQQQYLDKIKKEDKDKHPHKGNHEYHVKRQRPDKPKYNWRRRDVTEETPIPEAPKKEIPKPDREKYMKQLNQLKDQQDVLYKKKQALAQQFKNTMRNTNASKQNSKNVHTKYSAVLNQKHQAKKALYDQIKLLDEKKQELQRQLQATKQKTNSLKKPDSFEECSTEQLQKKLQHTEHKLQTASLTKKQQNQINMRILQIKRALKKSRSDVQVNAQIGKLQDHNDIVYSQLKDIRANLKEKYDKLREVKDEIGQLTEGLNKQKVQPEDNRAPQQIKAEFDKKFQAINKQIQSMKQKIKDFKTKFEKQQDDYEDYKDLTDYIKMIKQQKQKIKAQKQEKQRLKKQKQQEQIQRQKRIEADKKKREQKAKREEERRKEVQQRKQKLQKQKQEFINRNPHHEKIEICQSLVEYCESLKPQNVAAQKLNQREQKIVQPMLELNPKDSKQWEKQLKKGAQIIVSKKLKGQEQQTSAKKVPKEKKKKQANETVVSVYTHSNDYARMFDSINVLPPLTANELNDIIKQILDKVQIFKKPTEEQIAAYKQKAGKQFDKINGLYEQERGRKIHYKQKSDNHRHHEEHGQHENKEPTEKVKHKKHDKNEAVVNEKEFPGLQ